MRCADGIRQLGKLKLSCCWNWGMWKAAGRASISTLATREGTKDDAGLLLVRQLTCWWWRTERPRYSLLICVSLYLQPVLSGLPCLTKRSTTTAEKYQVRDHVDKLYKHTMGTDWRHSKVLRDLADATSRSLSVIFKGLYLSKLFPVA